MSVLPVRACPTSIAVKLKLKQNFGATLAAPVPSSIAAHLAFYTDATRTETPVLAPRGWNCGVTEGADGSTAVAIYPSPQHQLDRKGEAVLAFSPSQCQGCIYALVCPYVRGAGIQLGYATIACGSTPPPKEQLTWLRGSPSTAVPVRDVIEIEDPAGVAGDGDPSGGPEPSNSVVLYAFGHTRGSVTTDGAAQDTCVLPASLHSTCTAILNYFIATNWEMPKSSS